MDILTGNTIIFTDLHCGLSGNKLSKLKICINACNSIIKTANEKNVKNIIFAGDWFHSRSLLDTNTINVSLELVQALAKDRKLYLICGNHDAYFKNTTDVNSINIFRECNNVKIIDKTEEIQLNNQKVLLVPWLGDISNFKNEQFDIVIGHFDVSSKYIIKSYIEEHSSDMTSEKNDILKINSDNLIKTSSKTGDLVGSFVELAKPVKGVVYAGHIH
jgi:predicted MPP superfamily phosphohydrolase